MLHLGSTSRCSLFHPSLSSNNLIHLTKINHLSTHLITVLLRIKNISTCHHSLLSVITNSPYQLSSHTPIIPNRPLPTVTQPCLYRSHPRDLHLAHNDHNKMVMLPVSRCELKLHPDNLQPHQRLSLNILCFCFR